MQEEKDKRVRATNQARALLNTIRQEYPSNIVTDGYLRSLFPVQGTITTMKFPLLVNETIGNKIQVIENRLKLSDRFVVRDWSVTILPVAVADAEPTNTEMAVAHPITYPNEIVLGTAGIATNYEAVYNAKLNVTINSVVYYDSFPVRNFYRVPVSQQGVDVSAGANPAILRDGWDNMNYSFSPVYPTYTVDGLGNNQIICSLPSPIDLTGDTGFFNFIQLDLRGYLVQNVNQR